MRALFPSLFVLMVLSIFSSFTIAIESIEEPSSPAVINIDLNGTNDGWDDEEITSYVDEGNVDEGLAEPETELVELDEVSRNEETHVEMLPRELDEELQHQESLTTQAKLPGEEVDFRIKLHSSTHHMIDGRASSDIGKMLFKSRLMPSNEIKLSLKLKQKDLDDCELTAYIDLANFSLELDGSNSVLNKDHKTVMTLASAHLRSKFLKQYEGYDVPEHAFMLVQMLSYWSVSPEGFVHEKRSVVSQ